MGAVRRVALVLAVASLAVPIVARADTTTTYSAPFALGPTSDRKPADNFNWVMADPASGRVAVLRYNPVPTNGGLGCGGFGGYANLKVSHVAAGTVKSVTATFTEAAVDPYTFMNLRLRDGAGVYVDAVDARGPHLGEGAVTLDIASRGLTATGPLTIEFGLELTSACPNVDGGTARFTSISVTEA